MIVAGGRACQSAGPGKARAAPVAAVISRTKVAARPSSSCGAGLPWYDWPAWPRSDGARPFPGQGPTGMQIRILDLDGGLLPQQALLARHRPAVISARDWGPRIRLGCRFGRFRRFERDLTGWHGTAADAAPALTFC